MHSELAGLIAPDRAGTTKGHIALGCAGTTKGLTPAERACIANGLTALGRAGTMKGLIAADRTCTTVSHWGFACLVASGDALRLCPGARAIALEAHEIFRIRFVPARMTPRGAASGPSPRCASRCSLTRGAGPKGQRTGVPGAKGDTRKVWKTRKRVQQCWDFRL